VCSVCLVGSSEDELRLRLQLSLVLGHARPSTGGAFALRLVVFGRDFGLRWGARHHRPQHQERWGSLRYQVVTMGVAKISTRPVNLLRQGMGRAQSAIATTPQQRLCPSGGYASEDPGTVATAARRIVATSAGGGRPNRQSRPE
jgi:hypothetical protein